MKITNEHYSHIVDAIRPLKPCFKVYKDSLKSDPRVKDIEMRFRWDMAWSAKLSQFFSDNVYSYANDDHIDTALRAAIAEIEAVE